MADELEIRAPAEQTEGTRSQVLRWLKSVGDRVSADEPLIEIETDKVTVEVAAPCAGVLREILKQEAEEIEPGELLARLECATLDRTANEATGASTSGAATSGAATPAADPMPAAPPRSAAPAQMSPAVRRLLAERGLNAADIRGSGPGERITVEDVLGAAATVAPRPPGDGQPGAAQSALTEEGIHRVPHTAVRKRIAEHMVQSLLHTAPHVTSVFEADLAKVLEHRELHKPQFARQAVPLTLTAYFVLACVAAIRAVPQANCRWTPAALEIHDAIHIGIATAADSGLVVPVLRDAASKSLFEVARDLAALIARARAGSLRPEEVRGGTFTISNHGVSGSLLAAPIILNQPQSAILGIGKVQKRPVVLAEEQIGVAPMCYVTLTIDHRVMDGFLANRFLATCVQRLENWQS